MARATKVVPNHQSIPSKTQHAGGYPCSPIQPDARHCPGNSSRWGEKAAQQGTWLSKWSPDMELSQRPGCIFCL